MENLRTPLRTYRGLKSPLIGLDEDKLFTLAWNRKTYLWQAMRERGDLPGAVAEYSQALAVRTLDAKHAADSHVSADDAEEVGTGQDLGADGERRGLRHRRIVAPGQATMGSTCLRRLPYS